MIGVDHNGSDDIGLGRSVRSGLTRTGLLRCSIRLDLRRGDWRSAILLAFVEILIRFGVSIYDGIDVVVDMGGQIALLISDNDFFGLEDDNWNLNFDDPDDLHLHYTFPLPLLLWIYSCLSWQFHIFLAASLLNVDIGFSDKAIAPL